jgi:hypothetical protein
MFARSRAALGLALTLLCVAVPSLSAQAPTRNPLTLGLMGGATVPVGDFGDDAEVGFHGGALVGWMPQGLPIVIRGELQYHRNNLKLEFLEEVSPVPLDDASGHSTLTVAGAALEVGLMPSSAAVRPFVLVGAANYSAKISVKVEGLEVSDTESAFGFNFGGGLRFRVGNANVLVESRLHTFKIETTDIDDENLDVTFHFVPVSFGISF